MGHDKTEKTTVMFLSVDLKCSGCYKKVKKVLCKFPQIRDQIYSEEENKVRITVVCCSPEKIRDKLCYKGGGVIKSIEIIEHPKPQKPADKPKEGPKPEKPKDAPKPDKPKDAPKPDKPKDAPKPDKPKDAPKPDKPKDAPKPDKPKDAPKPDKTKDAPKPDKPKDDKPKEAEKPKGPPPPEPVPVPMKQMEPISNVPAPGQVTIMPVTHGYPPTMYCYEPSYEWYGTPVAPPPLPPPRPCYDNYSNWCRCGQVGGYYGCRCNNNTYFSEENTSECTIM